jgi:hypothetical protein
VNGLFLTGMGFCVQRAVRASNPPGIWLLRPSLCVVLGDPRPNWSVDKELAGLPVVAEYDLLAHWRDGTPSRETLPARPGGVFFDIEEPPGSLWLMILAISGRLSFS